MKKLFLLLPFALVACNSTNQAQTGALLTAGAQILLATECARLTDATEQDFCRTAGGQLVSIAQARSQRLLTKK